MNKRNVAASVRARLLNRARESRQDFNLILTRYPLERMLEPLRSKRARGTHTR